MTCVTSNPFEAAVTAGGFPLYSVYSAIITDRGGTPVPESNTRYWNKPTYPVGGTVYDTLTELYDAVQAEAGDLGGQVFRLATGTHAGNFVFNGGQSNYTICSDVQSGATITGNPALRIYDDMVSLIGLDASDFTRTTGPYGNTIRMQGDDGLMAFCTLSNITQLDQLVQDQWILVTAGLRNRVCYNTLDIKDSDGSMLKNVGENGLTTYCRFDHNKLLNHTAQDDPYIAGISNGAGAAECIQVGQDDAETNYHALVDNNYIYRHNNVNGVAPHRDTETFTIKAGSVIGIQNVFTECGGALNGRASKYSDFSYNFFFGNGFSKSRGIHIMNDGNRCIGNYTDSLNGASNDFQPGCVGLSAGGYSNHVACQNSEIAFNTAVDCYNPIIFGDDSRDTIPPDNNSFYNNAFTLTGGNAIRVANPGQAATNSTYGGNVFTPIGIADPGGITTEVPELDPDGAYQVPTATGNLDSTGAAGTSEIARMTDILGNSVPATNPNVGCFQSGWDLTIDPAQAIIDEAGV